MGNRELYLVLRDKAGTPLDELALHEVNDSLKIEVYWDSRNSDCQKPLVNRSRIIIPAEKEERWLIGDPHGIFSYVPHLLPGAISYHSRFWPGGDIQTAIKSRVRNSFFGLRSRLVDEEVILGGSTSLDMRNPKVVSYTIPVGFHSIRLGRVSELASRWVE